MELSVREDTTPIAVEAVLEKDSGYFIPHYGKVTKSSKEIKLQSKII